MRKKHYYKNQKNINNLIYNLNKKRVKYILVMKEIKHYGKENFNFLNNKKNKQNKIQLMHLKNLK